MLWTVVLEKTLESPLGSKDIHPVHPKGDQPWVFIGKIDAEAPILWLPDVKSWLNRKDADARKDYEMEVKGATEDDMVGRHHWLNEHEFEQTPGDGEGHRRLECCSLWGCKDLDMTENWTTTNTRYKFWSNHSSFCPLAMARFRHSILSPKCRSEINECHKPPLLISLFPRTTCEW